MENKNLKDLPLNDCLVYIQDKLEVGKEQKNTFGNYKYRTVSDILKSVKPLLLETNCTITMSDELQLIGDRYYILAIATLRKGQDTIHTCAYAREELLMKGMSSPQITGSTSTYARKYALNGLLAIDDETDPDGIDNNKDNPKQSHNDIQDGNKARSLLLKEIEQLIKDTQSNIVDILNFYNIKGLYEMDNKNLANLKSKLTTKLNKLNKEVQ